jgi:hypothetical protein
MLLAKIMSLMATVAADQPVRCSERQAYTGSTWVFHVGNGPAEVDVFAAKEVCTHEMPNKMQIVAEAYEFAFGDDEQVWKVKLLEDQKARAVECPRHSDCSFDRQDAFGFSGTWDVLYSQVLLVELENGNRFVANFAYKVKPVEENVGIMQEEVTAAQAYVQGARVFETWKLSERDHFVSHCDGTMVGFVQKQNGGDSLRNHHVQCFFGEMMEEGDYKLPGFKRYPQPE